VPPPKIGGRKHRQLEGHKKEVLLLIIRDRGFQSPIIDCPSKPRMLAY
jgi:hypothetical protein